MSEFTDREIILIKHIDILTTAIERALLALMNDDEDEIVTALNEGLNAVWKVEAPDMKALRLDEVADD